jgi:hypothetical protein
MTVSNALEWLEKKQDLSDEQLKTEMDDQAADDENNPTLEPKPLAAGEVARSLVCDICGKKFRSQAQAEFHGEKT